MGRLSPLEQKRRKSKRVGWALVAVSVVIVGALGIGVWHSMQVNPTLGEDLCVAGTLPTEYWAVIVDGTDPYSGLQEAAISQQFERLKDAIPKHARLALFAINPEPATSVEPILSLCNPGTGSELSGLTSNPEMVRRRWENNFDQPISGIIDTLLTNDEVSYSPILQTIQAVNIASDAYRQVPRKMFIFSDMMQHTQEYSHYRRGDVSFSEYSSSNVSAYTTTDLKGWEVTIFYARRRDASSQATQGLNHIRFWEDYVDSMGGTLVKVKSIEG